MSAPTLLLDGVTVSYRQGGGRQGGGSQGEAWVDAVRDVSFAIQPGETYGLVGESGSGKSTLALAIMQVLPSNGRLSAGRIEFGGQDLETLTDAERRRVWREGIKLVPQNPLPSLNPSHPVGRQLTEVLSGLGRGRDEALDLLAAVGLADPQRVADAYPHQLSGGMQQRVMIAMALGGEPDLLVLDEPTTNLDVTTEATMLDLIRGLVRDRNTAVLYVSHSLGVVAQLCDRVAVLYAGDLVEDAPVADLYRLPLHPYTQGLLDSVPRVGQDKRRVTLRPIPGQIPPVTDLPSGCIFAPRCPVAIPACSAEHPALENALPDRRARCIRWQEIAAGTVDARQAPEAATPAGPAEAAPTVLALDDLEKRFPVRRTLPELLRGEPLREIRAVDGIDLSVKRGHTLGLVGESGSGKSTLSRAIIGLSDASSGEMTLLDIPLRRELAGRDREVLRHLQMVFQSSDEALNPYRTVGQTLRRPFLRLAGLSRTEADRRVAELLAAVKLDPSYAARLPDQLSGGEKQRVAIARAFAAEPDLILFDESVSGLDVSVQAAILNLLGDLQAASGAAYLFISHDLSVVSYLADEVAVIYLGHLMEVGPTRDVLEPPYHPYTEALLSAIPLIDPEARRVSIRLDGDVPSPVDVPTGCRFHTRCPRYLGDICREEEPPWRRDERGNRIYCHIPLERLAELQERVFTFSTDRAARRSDRSAGAGDRSAGAGDRSAGAGDRSGGEDRG